MTIKYNDNKSNKNNCNNNNNNNESDEIVYNMISLHNLNIIFTFFGI